jgi:uncharacterized protein (DUF58 family)
VPERELIFPLIPARRSGQLEIAGRTSRRRGSGNEIAGSRPYRRGDTMKLVDWRASARLSTARARDEFVVRDRLAEDAVRVMVIVDRSPSMSLFPEELPWLHKPGVVLEAGRMILASSAAAHALVGYAEHAAGGLVLEHPRRNRALSGQIALQLAGRGGGGPPDSLGRTLEALSRSTQDVPAGTFVFVLSDFLRPPNRTAWQGVVASGWDVIPVIVQDPCWEQSFPDVAGTVLPLVDPASGALSLVRLRRKEAQARRAANELRLRALGDAFFALGVDPVTLSHPDRRSIHAAFLSWAKQRSAWTRRAR